MASSTTLERIRKLHALAASTTFAAEAATALRLADNLQAMAGITDAELIEKKAPARDYDDAAVRNWKAYVKQERPHVIYFESNYYGHVSYRKETPIEQQANAQRERMVYDWIGLDPRLR